MKRKKQIIPKKYFKNKIFQKFNLILPAIVRRDCPAQGRGGRFAGCRGQLEQLPFEVQSAVRRAHEVDVADGRVVADGRHAGVRRAVPGSLPRRFVAVFGGCSRRSRVFRHSSFADSEKWNKKVVSKKVGIDGAPWPPSIHQKMEPSVPTRLE